MITSDHIFAKKHIVGVSLNSFNFIKLFILVINACNTTISSMSKWGYKKEIETSKVCGANGECISDNLSDYRCSCHPGFTGEYCEISKEK